jgi:GT2 family glycosyltransferase
MGGILALFDFGDKARELDWPPYGANMAFRKKMFEKYGGFRTDLGPTPDGKIPRPNEDAEFGRRLMAAGERLWYEPSAVVHHLVPEKRLKRSYFLAWWFDKGRADVRQGAILSHTNWCCQGIPLYQFRRLSVWTLRWMLSIPVNKRFHCKLTVWAKLGEIAETRHQSLEAKKKRECNDEA